jgi:hypothetical protein
MIRTLVLIFGCLTLVGGCASAIQIPPTAGLLYYGPGNSFNATRPMGPGRVYLFDENQNKVVGVVAVSEKDLFNFSDVDPGHKYRIYFQPDVTLITPSSRPANNP